jgi:hypothetical protein
MAVQAAAANGVHFIKLYHGLDRPSLEAAVLEAHAHGLKVAADLTGWSSPAVEAFLAGIDGLEHFLPELGPGTGMPGWRRAIWDQTPEQLEELADVMAAQDVALTVTTGLDDIQNARKIRLVIRRGVARIPADLIAEARRVSPQGSG